VDNAVNVGVGFEHLVEGILLGDIELHELGLLAADQLHALEGLGRRVVQVVGNDNLVTRLEKGKGGERANVARATAGVSLCSIVDCIEETYPATRTEPEGMIIASKRNKLGKENNRKRTRGRF
jgi:hypothetical protein